MMRTLSVALVLVAALAASARAQPGWTITDQCAAHNQCPTVMVGVSCVNASLCAIVGGYSSSPMAVYTSTDGFASLHRANMTRQPLLMLDIALGADGASGVTAGVGFGLGSSALSHMTGGRIDQWNSSADMHFMQGQCVVALRKPNAFAFVGVSDDFGGQQGILLTGDGGATWSPRAWPPEVANMTVARYGAFVSSDIVYVTGGTWTHRAGSAVARGDCVPLSASRCVPVRPSGTGFGGAIIPGEKRFTAYITKTTDGGATWATQVAVLDDFYFNGIACASATQCVAVGEADPLQPRPGARIWATTDGAVWKHVLYAAGIGSLTQVRYRGATEVWAVGGQAQGQTAVGVVLRSLDAGSTWHQLAAIPNVYVVVTFQFVTPTLAYAVAANEDDSSTVLRFELA